MLNNSLFTSNSQVWTTPQDLFTNLNDIYNFTLDVAADAENTKCSKFFTEEDNALIQDWSGEVCFCNPPYNKVKDWIKKAYEESLKGATVVMLIPARPDTLAWRDYIVGKASIQFITGRLKFGGCTNSAPFPSCVIIFNSNKIANPLSVSWI